MKKCTRCNRTEDNVYPNCSCEDEPSIIDDDIIDDVIEIAAIASIFIPDSSDSSSDNSSDSSSFDSSSDFDGGSGGDSGGGGSDSSW